MKKSLLIVVLSILIWQPSFAKLECGNENYVKYKLGGITGPTIRVYECLDTYRNIICYFSDSNTVGMSCVKLD